MDTGQAAEGTGLEGEVAGVRSCLPWGDSTLKLCLSVISDVEEEKSSDPPSLLNFLDGNPFSHSRG